MLWDDDGIQLDAQMDDGDPIGYVRGSHELDRVDYVAVKRIMKFGSGVVGGVLGLPGRFAHKASEIVNEFAQGLGMEGYPTDSPAQQTPSAVVDTDKNR